MSRVAYVNGRYVPHRAAQVHIEDRGYQFADGVYEVFAVHRGGLIGEKGHMERLGHSVGAVRGGGAGGRGGGGLFLPYIYLP